MRSLQARFHFFPGDRDPLIVAVIVWHMTPHGARPVVHPQFGPEGTQSPVQILSELRQLVAAASQQGLRDPYHALLSLRGGCWSFVDVSAPAEAPAPPPSPDPSPYQDISPHQTMNRLGAKPGAGGSTNDSQVIVVY